MKKNGFSCHETEHVREKHEVWVFFSEEKGRSTGRKRKKDVGDH